MKTIHAILLLFIALVFISCDKKEEDVSSEIIGLWRIDQQVKAYTDYDIINVYPLCTEVQPAETIRCEERYWIINQDGTIDRSSEWTVDGVESNTVEHRKYYYSIKNGIIDIHTLGESIDGTIEVNSNEMILSGDVSNQWNTIHTDFTFRKVE